MSGKLAASPYRRTLLSTMITGGATVIVAIVSLLRSKLLALMVGPVGIGAMGMFNSAITLLAAMAGLGLTFSGVREIASSSGSGRQRIVAILWVLSLTGTLAVILALTLVDEGLIKRFLPTNFGQSQRWWIGVGLFAMVVAGVQMTVLQGLRQIRSLAFLRIFGAVFGAIIGLVAVWNWGEASLPFAVAAVPLGNVLAGLWFRPTMTADAAIERQRKDGVVAALLTLGIVSLITTVATGVWQFAVRSMVVDAYRLHEAGLYQAAFALSAMNVGLVLAALGADYFPRLVEAGSEKREISRIVEEQFRVTRMLAAPLLIGLLAMAPLALSLLYSRAFVPATGILQWQVLGDVLKLPGWIFGFVLVAEGKKAAYLFAELFFCAAILFLSWLLLPQLGLVGAGVAYTISYALYLGLVLLFVIRSGVAIPWREMQWMGVIAAIAAMVVLLWPVWPLVGVAIGLSASLVLGLWALRHLAEHGLTPSRIGRRGR